MSADKRDPSLPVQPRYQTEDAEIGDAETGNAGRAQICPCCLGKGAHHYPEQAYSLMCSRCLGTGTVRR